jgi:hypothetical protein
VATAAKVPLEEVIRVLSESDTMVVLHQWLNTRKSCARRGAARVPTPRALSGVRARVQRAS